MGAVTQCIHKTENLNKELQVIGGQGRAGKI